MLIAAAVISILFNLLGLMGAYKEHYCMTLTYAILMTLSTLGSIDNAIKTPVNWCSFVLSLTIAILAYAYARDLNTIRNQMFETPAFVIQPQTVVHMSPGQQYTSGGWQPPPAYNSGQNKSFD
jgi:O-antigen ligase